MKAFFSFFQREITKFTTLIYTQIYFIYHFNLTSYHFIHTIFSGIPTKYIKVLSAVRQISSAKQFQSLAVRVNWFAWVLWHIIHCRLFNAESSLYIYIYIYNSLKHFVDKNK